MEKYLYEDLNELEEKHWWHISKRKSVLNLISRFSKTKEPKILDIGCGTGKNLQVFSELGEAWGVDIAPEAIKYCQQKGLKNVKLVNGPKTDFPANSFDIITLLDVLEHVDEESTLMEIQRILKPDGLLIITVPAFSWLWSQWDVVLHHQRRYTANTLKTVLYKNNFKVTRVTYMYCFLVLPTLLVRTIKSFFYRNYYPSDFQLSSPLINNFMIIISNIERVVSNLLPIPIGTSLMCVASKDE